MDVDNTEISFNLNTINFPEQCSSEIKEKLAEPYKEDCVTRALHRKRIWSSYYRIRAKTAHDENKLRLAASLNDLERLQALLERYNVNPNAADSVGRTPLHIASSCGFSSIVEALLRRGANPNVEDMRGNTPLHLSVFSNSIETVKLLLHAGGVVRRTDRLKLTPLDMAESKLKIVQGGRKDYAEVKQQVMEIVDLLRQTVSRQKEEAAIVEEFSSKLSMNQESENINDGVKKLLDQLKSMNSDKFAFTWHPR